MTAAACSAALVAAPASAEGRSSHGGDPIKVIASGLNGPFELSPGGHGTIYVTESQAGKVTAVNTWSGRTRTVLNAPGATGAVRVGHKFAILTGASEAPPDQPPPPPVPGALPGSSVLTARAGGTPRLLADLEKYELANNPDGQTQFDPKGVPLDSVSNPFYILKDRSRRGFVLVADGGANDVLKVDRWGKVSTFFVPPTINTGACKGLPNNDKAVGCDAVPTGLAYGPRNTLYVSALTSEVPGEGRVYVLNASTGKLKRVITGFTAPTGVAVDRRGTVYVSELLEGAPEGDGPPPAGFDPSTVGQIVKVTRNGYRSTAQVTMPVGLLLQDGKLYSSAWSIAETPNAGQVVEVRKSAFVAATS